MSKTYFATLVTICHMKIWPTVKLTETMKRAKYIIKDAVQAIQDLDFGEDPVALITTLKKKNAK